MVHIFLESVDIFSPIWGDNNNDLIRKGDVLLLLIITKAKECCFYLTNDLITNPTRAKVKIMSNKLIF